MVNPDVMVKMYQASAAVGTAAAVDPEPITKTGLALAAGTILATAALMQVGSSFGSWVSRKLFD